MVLFRGCKDKSNGCFLQGFEKLFCNPRKGNNVDHCLVAIHWSAPLWEAFFLSRNGQQPIKAIVQPKGTLASLGNCFCCYPSAGPCMLKIETAGKAIYI